MTFLWILSKHVAKLSSLPNSFCKMSWLIPESLKNCDLTTYFSTCRFLWSLLVGWGGGKFSTRTNEFGIGKMELLQLKLSPSRKIECLSFKKVSLTIGSSYSNSTSSIFAVRYHYICY